MTERDVAAVLRDLATHQPGKSEADIQAGIRDILLLGGFGLSASAVRLESPAGERRRIDIEVGAVIIECKRNLGARQAVQEGEAQLAAYLAARAASGRRYVGLLTDGAAWRLYALTGDAVQLVDQLVLDPARLDDRHFRWWLGALLATMGPLPPTTDAVDEHFGAAAPLYALTHAALLACWQSSGTTPGVAVKRELWAKLLQTALGTQFEDSDTLFVDHTYLVLLATLIGYAIAGIPLAGPLEPTALLSGQPFRAVGLLGVGQSGFFDWVLDAPGGAEVVADLARHVSTFRWGQADHDVLKALYQSVIAPAVRKRLGEYYTPDWLARRMVAQVVGDPLGQRVLDPACGSGTFLFHAIRHYLEAAERAGRPAALAVADVTRHVIGVDLHPVAVVLAQTTYLLAIGKERLAQRGGAVSVPVYLGDSLQWESLAQADTYLDDGDLVFYAGVGAQHFDQELRFPEAIAKDVQSFELLLADLVDQAASRPAGGPRPSTSPVLASTELAPQDREVLQATYDVLCDLHDAGRDHIWGFYIRNQARPAWLSFDANRVDVLIGNPPWLAYRSMPPAMQAAYETWSRRRKLWQAGRRATGQDLSSFFVVRCLELYLAPGGHFGFVMPHAVLSRQPYAGFRTGRYTGNPPLTVAFDTPWDLAAVVPDPFPVPSCAIFGELNGAAAALPSETWEWSGSAAAPDGLTRRAGAIAGLAEGPAASAYRQQFHQGATLVPRVLVMVTPAPPFPFGGSPVGTRMIQSRKSARDKLPWRDLPANVGVVEDAFVRPVLLGESIAPFRPLAPALAVIPHDGTRLLAFGSVDLERHRFLSAWWRWAEREWRARRASPRLTLTGNVDYMHKLSAQFPIAPWRVVYTASGTTLAAAVVHDDRAVVEHNLYWAAVQSPEEARYLAAVLNAPELTARVRPLQARGAFGPRHFDKYVWAAPVPRFNADNAAHRHLAALGQACEEAAATVLLPPDALAAQARRAIRQALERQGLFAALDEALTAVWPAASL